MLPPTRQPYGSSIMEDDIMSLIRWDPFASVDEQFTRALPGLFASWPRFALHDSAARLEWRPSADISESEQEYLIRAELPAVKKEDVKVTVDNNIVTIQGERKQTKEHESEKVHRMESFYGSFARSFSLPDNANADAIRCESKDGILTVHVPKRQTERQKVTQIKVE
jgi:HSP20 family protein